MFVSDLLKELFPEKDTLEIFNLTSALNKLDVFKSEDLISLKDDELKKLNLSFSDEEKLLNYVGKRDFHQKQDNRSSNLPNSTNSTKSTNSTASTNPVWSSPVSSNPSTDSTPPRQFDRFQEMEKKKREIQEIKKQRSEEKKKGKKLMEKLRKMDSSNGESQNCPGDSNDRLNFGCRFKSRSRSEYELLKENVIQSQRLIDSGFDFYLVQKKNVWLPYRMIYPNDEIV